MNSINEKGQFFSPDLVVAVIVFITCLSFFFIGLSAIQHNISLNESKIKASETIHLVLNSLVYSSGYPINWETKNISDVELIGLVVEENVLSEQKLLALKNFLDSNNVIVREKLGLGAYSFNLQLIDSSGSIVDGYSSNYFFVNPEFVLNYDRIVLLDEKIFVLRGVIGLEE